MNKNKRIHITKHNKAAILEKANRLVNEGVSLKRVLQRCRISYRQLLKLSRDPDWHWDDNVIFRDRGYQFSSQWCANEKVALMRNFAVRGHALGLSKLHLAFLLNRSVRTIYRYLDTHRQIEI